MDFGARNYNAAIGRWMNIDNFAERAPSITPFRYGFNNPIKFFDPDGNYERDGHFWTVYVAGLVTGRKDAGSLAYWAEYPDQVMSKHGDVLMTRDTWKYWDSQIGVHALTGKSATYERARSRNWFNRATYAEERGAALHRLGDSYAHSKVNGKMYDTGLGHLFQWHAPDKIAKRPELYLEYVRDLVQTLGGDENTDLFAFEYIAGSGGTTDENSAVLETEVSIRSGIKSFAVGDGMTR